MFVCKRKEASSGNFLDMEATLKVFTMSIGIYQLECLKEFRINGKEEHLVSTPNTSH